MRRVVGGLLLLLSVKATFDSEKSWHRCQKEIISAASEMSLCSPRTRLRVVNFHISSFFHADGKVKSCIYPQVPRLLDEDFTCTSGNLVFTETTAFKE